MAGKEGLKEKAEGERRSMKKALIIGGSGGLSSVVAKLAMKNGYEVWALTRGKRELPEGVNALIADRNNDREFETAIENAGIQWDVVFDCICMNRKHAVQDIRIVSKVCKRIVVVSTDSVYDPYHKETPQTEEGVFLEEAGPDESVSYGCNKRRMELEFCSEMGKEDTELQITIFRPGHIYGPGFLLGCFPENSRQKELPDLILQKKPVKLVGLGTYLIHPIFVEDLARVMVECATNERTFNRIFCIGGPEAVENKLYYEYIAEALGVNLETEEVPLKGYLQKHPEFSGHLCHRIYDLSALKETGIALPNTHLRDGIRIHLRSLGY